MTNQIPEKDWKKLKALKHSALKTACDGILDKVRSLIESGINESYVTYKKLWKILESEDEKISLMFDDLKRSTGTFKLAMWRENNILSDKDFSDLTEETQKRINSILEIRR